MMRPKLTCTGRVLRYDIFGRKATTDTNLVETFQGLPHYHKNFFGLFYVICESSFRSRKNLARPKDRSLGYTKDLQESANQSEHVKRCAKSRRGSLTENTAVTLLQSRQFELALQLQEKRTRYQEN